MANASQIVDALLIGFENQDHPSVQAALDHLMILIELNYKPGEGAAPRENIRYDAIREALNTFRVSPLSAINRLVQELHDIEQAEPDIDIAIQILIETVERMTTIQPTVSPIVFEDADEVRPADEPLSADEPPDLSVGASSGYAEPEEAEEPSPRKKRGFGGLFGGRADDAVEMEEEKSAEPPPSAAPPPAPAKPAPSAAPGSPPPSLPPAGAASSDTREEQAKEERALEWLDDFSGEVDSEVLEKSNSELDDLAGLEDEKTIAGDPEWLNKEVRRQKFITETGTFNRVVSDDDTAELPAAAIDDEGSAPEEAAQEAYFSAYFPREIREGVSYGFYVYAHTIEALETIKQNIAQFKDKMGGEVPKATQAESHTTLAYGTMLTIVPEAEGVVFDPPQQSRTWNNDWTRFEFDFMTEGAEQTQLEIHVSVQIAGIEIAHIFCGLTVSETGDSPRRSINPLADARLHAMTARMYQKIFVSYSRQDNLIAERYRLAQMAAGQDVFMDSYSIRAGEDWQAALARAIDEADIFQLFWSPNSAQSENVRHEWEYALGYRCPEDQCVSFIRPVFWQKPLTTPPGALSHLNFKFVPFSGIKEVESKSPTKARSSSPGEVMERLDSLDNRMTAIEDSLEIIKQALRAIYHKLKE